MPIKFLYFDVANTLLNKPSIWPKIKSVLANHGYNFEEPFIRERHKLVSEIIKFPDKTSHEFYTYFNEEFLMALGVSITKEIIEEIFKACDNQPWEKFHDTKYLDSLTCLTGILSNWDCSLIEKLPQFFNLNFDIHIVSAIEGVSKPDPKIFSIAIEKTGLKPEEIGFVGDSIKLDIIPALKAGIQPILIDRDNMYSHFKGLRIKSFEELKTLIN